jgi:6-phosphogluconolactonase
VNTPHPFVDISTNTDELVERLANTFTAFVRARLEHAGADVHLCLTGGRVADAVHQSVAKKATDLPWNRIHVWWGDERFLDFDSPERNDRQAIRALLAPVGSPESNWHRFPDTSTGELPRAATSFASHVASNAPVTFDLVMLGAGEDGHVASLFPGHHDPQHGDVVAVADSPKPPSQRLSLTASRLVRTDECWVLAGGAAKAEALAAAWSGEDVPLGDLSRSARENGVPVTWFLDRDAAHLLPGYDEQPPAEVST